MSHQLIENLRKLGQSSKITVVVHFRIFPINLHGKMIIHEKVSKKLASL